ncbi:hypothetical protein LY76DRAFT_592682 [Colletotrichum caudatum]|nr:hypothetical protein LY76DRAFT_592682 [Colletotrichum caudatum]
MLCVTIITAVQWLWSFVVSRTAPYIIPLPRHVIYVLFGTLMVLMGISAFFFVPETKRDIPGTSPSRINSRYPVADTVVRPAGLTVEDMHPFLMRSTHNTV